MLVLVFVKIKISGIFQINEKAVFFPLLWNDEDPIFGTEAQFLVDEHGGNMHLSFLWNIFI